MPFPKQLTRFNRRVANPLMKQIARWIPLMGIVVHTGRTTGKRYETPILVFPFGAVVTFALTYGTDVDWLKNVRAAGGCTLIYRRRERELTRPRMLSTAEGLSRMPLVIRTILRFTSVDHFLELAKCLPGSRSDGGL